MSLIAFAWKVYPHYPLLLLANRDEFYDRPSSPLQRWEDPSDLYAGKDLRAGGTWLGITPQARFAAVTDFHHHGSPEVPPPHSRGLLVRDYLASDLDPESYLEASADQRRQSLPHNLILGDHNTLFYSCSATHAHEELSPGIYSLGDYFMNTPMPKVKYVRDHLEKCLKDGILDPDEQEEMFKVLNYPMRFAKNELPERGYPSAYEHEHSPVFVHLEKFGTVSSSLLLADTEGQVRFEERSFSQGKPSHSEVQNFELEVRFR